MQPQLWQGKVICIVFVYDIYCSAGFMITYRLWYSNETHI